jgi:TolB protein
MKSLKRCIICWLIWGLLIVACSPIAVLPEANSASRQPTAQPEPESQAQAEPDNVVPDLPGKLLYVQDGNVFLRKGTQTEQITDDGKTYEPAWAPDQRRIAVVRYKESHSNIHVIDTQTRRATQITFIESDEPRRSEAFVHQVVWAAAPAWTPDGDALVFLSQQSPATSATDNPPLYEYPLALYRYPLALTDVRPPSNDDLLLRLDHADLQRPTWAPDGSLLTAVEAPRDGRPRQIIIFDPATGTIAPFPNIPEDAYDPAWSHDSRWLAFAAVVDGQTDIWAVPHPEIGGDAVRLTTLGNVRAPAWSPDGSQLAFIQVREDGADIYVMALRENGNSLAGGDIQALTSTGQIDASSGLSWADSD